MNSISYSSLWRKSLFFVMALVVPAFGTSQSILLGDWTLWSINDGHINLPQKIFAGIDPDVVREALNKSHVEQIEDLVVRTPINAFLVDTGDSLVLIDAGCGKICGETTGLLASSLQASGHEFKEVTHILLTHLHPDHIGGLITTHGNIAFPNAKIYVSKVEADYWRSTDEEAKAPEHARYCFPLVRATLAPYEANDQLQLIESDEEIMPGIKAVDSHGHTPGHLAFLIGKENHQFLSWGDLVHSVGVQFANPQWSVFFDSDLEQAMKSRIQLFEEASQHHYLVGGAHHPDAGLGYVMKEGDAYVWQPYSFE